MVKNGVIGQSAGELDRDAPPGLAQGGEDDSVAGGVAVREECRGVLRLCSERVAWGLISRIPDCREIHPWSSTK